MAEFELTQVPERVAERLDAVAADAVTRGQEMFAKALEDQRALLTALAGPASSLLTATAARAQRLAAPPPPAPPPAPAPSGSTGSSDADPS
jgi:hypothetical protein